MRSRWQYPAPAIVVPGLLCLVLIVAGWFRLSGLTWGLGNGYGHHRSFQPDEFISLRGTLSIDIRSGRLKAPAAYFEGTFNYYLWELPVAVREWLTGRTHRSVTYTDEEADFALLSGRLMTVMFDLVTIIVMFLIVKEAGGRAFAGITAAFLYSVIPMQVIYAHFMRTHVLSNLLCALVIWLSLRAIKHPAWWRYFVVGTLSGLGAATHYPVGIIVSIPCLLLLFQLAAACSAGTVSSWTTRIRSAINSLAAGPIWWLALGAIVGLFIGEPYLFIDPTGVYHAISYETFKYVPGNAGKLFDLLPLWNYVSVLIPYAMFPLVWLASYGATAYLCFRRDLCRIAIPLLIFMLLYAYPMSKGYLGMFARQVMLLFPVFSAFIALSLDKLWQHQRRSKPFFFAAVIILILLLVPSILFDWAYVRAMGREDVRVTLRNDLRAASGNARVKINVSPTALYFYTAMPAADPLTADHQSVALRDQSALADYFILGFERPLSVSQLTFQVRNIEASGNFKYVRMYYSAPSIFGKTVDLSRFPPDMIYPFPTILLFRSIGQG
jgi:hypothetical protein